MRPFLTASLLLLAGLASVASADPSPPSLTDTSTPAPSPHASVTGGFLVGGFASQIGTGVSLELRGKITEHVLLHLEGVAASTLSTLFNTGAYYSGRAGVEVSSCTTIQTMCAYAGVDAGYAYAKQVHSGLFGDRMSSVARGATGVLRGGLDIGGKHVRWRPGVEAAVVGPREIAVTQSIAVTF